MSPAAGVVLLLFAQDPLVYSTFFGGTLSESASVVRTDAAGDIYLAGTSSSDGPPFDPMDPPTSVGLGYVAKFNRYGTLLWARRYPVAEVRFMELDPAGGIYLLGRSIRGSLPVTEGVFQPAQTNAGQYAMKLNSSGTIEWATYIANQGALTPLAISVSNAGRLAICGISRPDDIPLSANAAPFPESNLSQPFCLVLAPGASSVEHASILGSAGGLSVSAVIFRDEESLLIGGSLLTWVPPEGVENPRRSAFRLETDNATVTAIGNSALGAVTSLGFSGDKLFLKSAFTLTTSEDQGATLASALPINDQGAQQLIVHPLDSRYLCTGLNPLRCSRDGAATFTQPPFLNNITLITADPRQAGVFYFISNGVAQAISLQPGVPAAALRLSGLTYLQAFDDGQQTAFVACEFLRCSISKNNGASFEPLQTPERFNFIEVSKSNPTVWYATHNFYGGTYPIVFRTSDAGATWTPTTLSFQQMRGQFLSLRIDPNNPDRLAVLSSQGFWLSENGGQQWRNLLSLFPNRSIAAFAFGPDSRLYAGADSLGLAYTSRLSIPNNQWDSPRVLAPAPGGTYISHIRPDGSGGHWLLGHTYTTNLAATEEPLLPDNGERTLGLLMGLNDALESTSVRLMPFAARRFEVDPSGGLAFFIGSTPGGYSPPEGVRSAGTPTNVLDGFVLSVRPGELPGLTWLPHTSIYNFPGFALLPDGQFVIAGSGSSSRYPVTADAAKPAISDPPTTDAYLSIYRLP